MFRVDSNGSLGSWNVDNKLGSFYNPYVKLWQNIVELGYKIFPKELFFKNIKTDILCLSA